MTTAPLPKQASKSATLRWNTMASVWKGSAAEKAGLKAGDVITKIGGHKVTRPSDISNALRSLSSTKAVPVTIVRDRKELSVSVTIEEKSSETIRRTIASLDL